MSIHPADMYGGGSPMYAEAQQTAQSNDAMNSYSQTRLEVKVGAKQEENDDDEEENEVGEPHGPTEAVSSVVQRLASDFFTHQAMLKEHATAMHENPSTFGDKRFHHWYA